MKFNDMLKKLLKDKKFRKEYERYDLPFEVSELIIDMRVSAGLTQAKLARKAGMLQPTIARAENGSRLPSLSFLQKLAHAAGGEIYVTFAPKKSKRN